MPSRITTHPTAPCGCKATSVYSWSDSGLFDDGETYVQECAWHGLQQAAFNTWLCERNERIDAAVGSEAVIAIQNETFDEVFWMQVVERQDEWDTFLYDHSWEQAAREIAYANCPF